MAAIVVFCTASSAEEARKLADALVGEKLAACVSTMTGLQSTYWWQGHIERAEEVLLIIKTESKQREALLSRIRTLHSYSVPEILALPVKFGNPDYLRWLTQSIRPTRPPKKTS
jgi:periplasmic divalent cation tolerance protein